MDVTIAVCTRDRAPRLDRLLRSFCQLKAPAVVTWEVLVIDNGSTDPTQDVVASYRNQLPLRYAMEPCPGISYARNLALSQATGALLMFTDDDCTVQENWLNAYMRGIDRYPLADIFAGPVEARFYGPRSELADALLAHAPTAIANFSFGKEDVRIDHNSHISKLPFGANFAVRRRAFHGMQFDLNLGRTGHEGILMGGEETRFICDLLNSGHVGWLLPDAVVEHWIDPDRETIEYLSKYFYAVGLQLEPLPRGPGIFLSMRRLLARLRLHLAKLGFGSHSPAAQVQRVRDLSVALGALDSRFINPASRMVDASGRTIRRIKQ